MEDVPLITVRRETRTSGFVRSLGDWAHRLVIGISYKTDRVASFTMKLVRRVRVRIKPGPVMRKNVRE